MVARLPEPGYFSVDDAAAYAGVTRYTILRWVKTGQLVGYRMGPRQIRIKRVDLDAMLEPIEPTGDQ